MTSKMKRGNKKAELHIEHSSDDLKFNTVTEQLTDALDEINPHSTIYQCVGQNVGWRNISDKTEATIEDGKALLQLLIPDTTQWKADITVYDTEINLEIFHHDSPTGETHIVSAP